MKTVIRTKSRKGFTLVEILIVVIILGILAAIVIPQFTNASEDARKSNMRSQLQTLRSQVELYKLQHRDTAPTLANFWTALTTKTLDTGAAAGAATDGVYGPYMQEQAVNPLTNSSTPVATGTAAATTTGWYYDEANGIVHGANKTGAQSDDGE
jgi:general secretion pathway protein G